MKTLKSILIVVLTAICNLAFSVTYENSDSAYKSGSTDFSHETYVSIAGDIYKLDATNINVAPVKLNINTRFDESCPVLSGDSNTLYFVSNRKGGYGGRDIWASERLSDGNFCKPYNLGSNINSEDNENNPSILNDGVTLLFTRNETENTGLKEYYSTTMNDDGLWSVPEKTEMDLLIN